MMIGHVKHHGIEWFTWSFCKSSPPKQPSDSEEVYLKHETLRRPWHVITGPEKRPVFWGIYGAVSRCFHSSHPWFRESRFSRLGCCWMIFVPLFLISILDYFDWYNPDADESWYYTFHARLMWVCIENRNTKLIWSNAKIHWFHT